MIIYLAKAFKEREHAEKFILGEMYCKQLTYFKKLEDREGRGDPDEGAIVLPLEGLDMTLGTKTPGTGEAVDWHTIQGLAAPPVVVPEWFDHIKIFCMFAAHSGGFQHEPSESYLDRLKEHLKIPEKYVTLGEHAVVITNVTEFFRRVENAAHQAGFGIRSGLVKYYDPEVGTPPVRSDIETIFCKAEEYGYQREFRIAIDTGTTEGGPISLDVGNISDIAFRTDTGGLRIELNTTA